MHELVNRLALHSALACIILVRLSDRDAMSIAPRLASQPVD